MLRGPFYAQRLERNLGNTFNPLWITLLITARIVSSLAPLQRVFALIRWTYIKLPTL